MSDKANTSPAALVLQQQQSKSSLKKTQSANVPLTTRSEIQQWSSDDEVKIVPSTSSVKGESVAKEPSPDKGRISFSLNVKEKPRMVNLKAFEASSSSDSSIQEVSTKPKKAASPSQDDVSVSESPLKSSSKENNSKLK